MKTKALLIITCVLISCFALAQAKAPANKSAEKKAPAKTAATTGTPDKAMLQKVMDAWASMNTDNAGKYYDKAARDIFYDVAPLKYTGWEEYAAGAKQLFATLQSLKFTVNDDAVVHHGGNLAWTTATVHLSMTDKAGKTTDLDCRWTTIWEKKGPNWLIVHEHFSAPLPMSK